MNIKKLIVMILLMVGTVQVFASEYELKSNETLSLSCPRPMAISSRKIGRNNIIVSCGTICELKIEFDPRVSMNHFVALYSMGTRKRVIDGTSQYKPLREQLPEISRELIDSGECAEVKF